MPLRLAYQVLLFYVVFFDLGVSHNVSRNNAAVLRATQLAPEDAVDPIIAPGGT
jgi:hypothetical protein